MEGIKDDAAILQAELATALGKIGYTELSVQEEAMREQMSKPDFWQDTANAQNISQQQARLDRRLKPWRDLQQDMHDLNELLLMDDDSILHD